MNRTAALPTDQTVDIEIVEDTRPSWASERIDCDPIGFATYSEEFPTLRLAKWVEPQPDLLVEINDCHEFPPAAARRFAAEIIRLADIAEGRQRADAIAPLASTPVAVLCVASGHQYVRLQLLDQTVMLNIATAVDLVDAIATELAFCSPDSPTKS